MTSEEEMKETIELMDAFDVGRFLTLLNDYQKVNVKVKFALQEEVYESISVSVKGDTVTIEALPF